MYEHFLPYALIVFPIVGIYFLLLVLFRLLSQVTVSAGIFAHTA